MSTTTAAPLNPGHIDAPPLRGNFTDEASTHIHLAESLASILCGPGIETFTSYADQIQDGVLYLLACEIRRARQALAAESTRSLPSKGAAR